MKPDMIFGWQPEDEPCQGAPIPLFYDYEVFDEPEEDPLLPGPMVIFYGFRPANTHVVHKQFAHPSQGKYYF
jgi:hypothetical protein